MTGWRDVLATAVLAAALAAGTLGLGDRFDGCARSDHCEQEAP